MDRAAEARGGARCVWARVLPLAPAMLRRLAVRFPGILELDLSQSPSRSFYPGVIDDNLDVIAGGFRNLRVLAL